MKLVFISPRSWLIGLLTLFCGLSLAARSGIFDSKRLSHYLVDFFSPGLRSGVWTIAHLVEKIAARIDMFQSFL